MRTRCAIPDAFVRDCVFAHCAGVAQYVYSLSAEHCFRLRKSAISDERVRDCALYTHSVFRPLCTVAYNTSFLDPPVMYVITMLYMHKLCVFPFVLVFVFVFVCGLL